MKALLAEMRERLDPVYRQHALADPKVFRIHRDVRFSRDKAPYKTHIGGYVPIEGGGSGPAVPAAVYFHVGASEMFAAAGHYMMDPAQLRQFRDAVADDTRGSAIAAIVRRLTRGGFMVGSHEQLARVPRGFDADHPRADLLRRKGLIVSFPAMPGGLLASRRLVDWLVAGARRAAPLVDWLATTVE